MGGSRHSAAVPQVVKNWGTTSLSHQRPLILPMVFYLRFRLVLQEMSRLDFQITIYQRRRHVFGERVEHENPFGL